MDKFHGISRAEVVSTSHRYEIVDKCVPKYKCVAREDNRDGADFLDDAARGKIVSECGDIARDKTVSDCDEDCAAKSAARKSGRGGMFTVFRYGLCAAVLLVCLLGKFVAFEPLKEASAFIKDELARDSITEIYDANE